MKIKAFILCLTMSLIVFGQIEKLLCSEDHTHASAFMDIEAENEEKQEKVEKDSSEYLDVISDCTFSNLSIAPKYYVHINEYSSSTILTSDIPPDC